MSDETIRDGEGLLNPRGPQASAPGLVLLFSGTKPYLLPFVLGSAPLVLGREEFLLHRIEDDRASRRHASVEREGNAVRVRDLGSTNGLFLRGERVVEEARVAAGEVAVLRVGRTLLLVVPDVRPFEAARARPMAREGLVAGPALHVVHQQIAALGRAGEGLFLRGESGAGKELAARVYHEASPRRSGPLVAVNCAAVPRELAERLFFGALKGAYSGSVADSQGYLQAARGGTLFLDEVAELDPAVQSKLLRALETREVLPLGSTKPQPVELGLCAATHKDLREAVASGSFREDLYYRIGRPEVRLPPLRERPEEIPFLLEQTLRAAGLEASTAFVEQCLLRPWPGNVRELCAEARAAAALAKARGEAQVQPQHLDPQAGQLLTQRASAVSLAPSSSGAHEAAPARPSQPSVLSAAEEALLDATGEALGLARKTLLKLAPAAELSALAASSEDATTKRTRLRAVATEALRALLEGNEYNLSAVATTLGVSRTTLNKLVEDLGLPRATNLDAEAIERAWAQVGGDLERAAQLLQVSPTALRKRRVQLGLR